MMMLRTRAELRWSMSRGRWRCRRCLSSSPSTSTYAGFISDGDHHSRVPVLIIGAGPVGLVLSILLTKLDWNGGNLWVKSLNSTEMVSTMPPPLTCLMDESLADRLLGQKEVMEHFFLDTNLAQTKQIKLWKHFLMPLSFLLGIECSILEKSTIFSHHPQAHFINNRSMELFRKLDGLSDDIERLQPPVDLWRKFIYCTSLSGSILGSVDHMQPEDFERKLSPISVAHLSQYKLTRLLLQKLENLGFCICSSDKVDVQNSDGLQKRMILLGHECISVNPTSQGVTVESSFNREGKVLKRNVQCSILVGSDGARSTVRKIMGIDMEGKRDLQRLISVHFLSKELGQYLLHQRPGMLFFIFNPEGIGVLVAHDLNEGEFVLQIPYYPPQQNAEDFNCKVCEEIIFKLVGWSLVDVNVVDIKPWVMHAEVAGKYIVGHDRVILIGDAAHRFPPAGGFGMNTGLQDAQNLAWKIASIANGNSSPSILQTYEMERRPVALFNTSLSIENLDAAMSVPVALGLDPGIANSVHWMINSKLGEVLPSGLQRVVLEGLLSIGRYQLSETILNESNPIGASRLAKLRSIFNDGKSLQLQFPAEDLGFRYTLGALVPENDNQTDKAPQAAQSIQRSRAYVPSAKPGCRLPHMYVKHLDARCNKEQLSTLDLISGDKLEWVLIIAPRKKSYDLARAALEAAETYKVSLKICTIWPEGSSEENKKGSEMALLPWTNYVDVEEVVGTKPGKSWWAICKMSREGAILVRPDEHVAWRANSESTGCLKTEMERIFSLVLCIGR